MFVPDRDHGQVFSVLDAHEEARQVLDLVVEPGAGFVEQQELPLIGQGAGETDDLLHAEGQAATGSWRVLQFDEVENLLDHLAVPDLLAPHAGQEQALAARGW